MKEYGYEEKVLAQYCYDGKQPEFYLAFPVHLIERTVCCKLPKTLVPGHRHDFFEISYVLSGRAIQRVNDQAFQIGEGDLCIINKGVDHAIIPEKDGSVKQMVLKLLPGYLLHHLLENRNAKHLICLLSHCSSFYFVKKEQYDARKTLRILSEMVEELTHKNLGYSSYVTMLIEQLAIGFFRDHILDTTLLDANDEHINTVGKTITYIEDHFRGNVTLKTVSKALNISYCHLSRIFKKQTGWSFTRYVNFVRVCSVEKLITQMNSSITDAVWESGFTTISHFNRVYKQFWGYSPSQYVARMKKSA